MKVWEVFKEVDGGKVKIKALALKKDLAKRGLTSEEDVRKIWEEVIRVAGDGAHVKVTSVKFLNVYCVVEMEAQCGVGLKNVACLQAAPKTVRAGSEV